MARQWTYGSGTLQPEPQFINVTESTCFHLSLFKDIMKEYRRLDDSVTMRLNRNNAQWRDKDRLAGVPISANHDDACASFWRELVANWTGRKAVIDYCVGVVGQAVADESRASDISEEYLSTARKSTPITENTVKRKQIHQELMVETIVRRRSWEAFTSRCKHWRPPLTDVEARKWWDAAASNSHVE
ncbi:hypothetical protein DL93DRAFT_2081937 [Clavulina sp. PMI_390]|nr:hypothetical protein DL93DRAFT_2081937 [Clavulina sp. PMI_390]